MKYLPLGLASLLALELTEARPVRSPQTINLRSHGGQRVRSTHPGRENVSLRDWIVNTDLQVSPAHSFLWSIVDRGC